jgi:hypothetical protein
MRDKELNEALKKNEYMGKAYQAKALKEQQLNEALTKRQRDQQTKQ